MHPATTPLQPTTVQYYHSVLITGTPTVVVSQQSWARLFCSTAKIYQHSATQRSASCSSNSISFIYRLQHSGVTGDFTCRTQDRAATVAPTDRSTTLFARRSRATGKQTNKKNHYFTVSSCRESSRPSRSHAASPAPSSACATPPKLFGCCRRSLAVNLSTFLISQQQPSLLALLTCQALHKLLAQFPSLS